MSIICKNVTNLFKKNTVSPVCSMPCMKGIWHSVGHFQVAFFPLRQNKSKQNHLVIHVYENVFHLEVHFIHIQVIFTQFWGKEIITVMVFGWSRRYTCIKHWRWCLATFPNKLKFIKIPVLHWALYFGLPSHCWKCC